MTGQEVGLTDKVGPADFLCPEAKVGNRKAPGLLGIVGEVSLDRKLRLCLSDDLDGVLVGPNGTV